MKEYRYITFRPETDEELREYLAEKQYNMENFDLQYCEEIEKYVDFERSKLVINVRLQELQESLKEKYKKQILNLILTTNEIESGVIIPQNQQVRYVNGCKISEYEKRRENYLAFIKLLERCKSTLGYDIREDMLQTVFNSTTEPELTEQMISIDVIKNQKSKKLQLPTRINIDQFDDYEWIMYHDFQNFTVDEIKTLTNGKIIQETVSRMIIILDKLDEKRIAEILKICEGRKQLSIKVLPTDVNKLLAMKVRLSRERFNISYSCNTIAQAPIELIDQLGINSVLIGALENSNVQEMEHEKYKKINSILNNIVKSASRRKTEYGKFITVYRKLAKILSYDMEEVRKEDEQDYLPDEDFYSSRNLENGLLKGRCVCVGYAEILKQALSLLNIECQNCTSEVTEEGDAHVYNQVKIDGIWYNTDLTWDSNDIRKHRIPKYCLKSDKDFRKGLKEDECLHYSTDIEVKRCHESYKNRIVKFFEIKPKIAKLFKKRTDGQLEDYAKSEKKKTNNFKQRYMQKIDTSLINATEHTTREQKEEIR